MLIGVVHCHLRSETTDSGTRELPSGDKKSRGESSESDAYRKTATQLHLTRQNNATESIKYATSKHMYKFAQRVMMGEKELDLFDRMLSKGSVYFEFGMGGSTLFASEHPNLKHITAVDASSEWVEKVRKEESIGADIRSGRIQLEFVDIGPVGEFSMPLESNPEKERNYSRAIVGAQPIPDVVLVDGRYRPACLMMTLLEAMRQNWTRLTIMMHDYNRAKYQDVAERVLGKPTDLQGSDGRLLSSWELSGEMLKNLRMYKMAEAERLEQQYEIDPSSISINSNSDNSTSNTSSLFGHSGGYSDNKGVVRPNLTSGTF
jgi:hypothetical protein